MSQDDFRQALDTPTFVNVEKGPEGATYLLRDGQRYQVYFTQITFPTPLLQGDAEQITNEFLDVVESVFMQGGVLVPIINTQSANMDFELNLPRIRGLLSKMGPVFVVSPNLATEAVADALKIFAQRRVDIRFCVSVEDAVAQRNQVLGVSES